jgi:diguanylate cyclase (GGDEF)-like protein
VVDDEPSVLRTLAALLGDEFQVLTADSAEGARKVFAQREVDILLTDQKMPGQSGVQLLEWVKAHSPRTVRLMMTGLGRLEDAVDAINCGQVHYYLFKPWRSDELKRVIRGAARTFLLERSHEQLLDQLRHLNQELEQRVRQRTRELEEANRQLQQKNALLEKLALTDTLTGLPNRRYLDRLARAEFRRRTRYAGALALGVVDVDDFKAINSQYLLPGGDQVLVHLAQVLAGSVRTVDSVARIGGEEFMVLAPETTVEGAAILAERIRANVQHSRARYQDHEIAVTVSVGFAVAEAFVPASYEQLKHLAANALEEAKRNGKNCCVVRALPAPLERVG